MPHRTEERLLTEICEDDAMAAGALLAKTWPRPDRGPVERAKQLIDIGRDYDGPAELTPRSFLIFDEETGGGQVIAHAQVSPRTIEIAGTELTVLALAKVATDTDRRGEGLGALVVQACFDLVDRGVFPHSLFQTSHVVEPFYLKLGCVKVTSRVYNSLSAADPTANPFWDDIVMRYTTTEAWPEGEIDLRGPGY